MVIDICSHASDLGQFVPHFFHVDRMPDFSPVPFRASLFIASGRSPLPVLIRTFEGFCCAFCQRAVSQKLLNCRVEPPEYPALIVQYVHVIMAEQVIIFDMLYHDSETITIKQP